MVFFTCNHCGDSVKKNKVEKHYQTKCRNGVSVSCMDCNKGFDNLTYDKHTKCISEEEKYSAVGFQPKLSAKRVEERQEKWMDVVRAVMNRKDLTPEQSKLERFILERNNLPRKKIKFQNFIKNQQSGVNLAVVGQLWDMMQKQFANTTEMKKNGVTPKNDNKKELEENKGQEMTALDVNALSKKERKQLKKKTKYEAELQDIKNEPSGEIMESEARDEVKQDKKKKKSKKNGIDENTPGDSDLEVVQQNDKQLKKKGKKRKVEEIGDAVSESVAKINKENGNTGEVVLGNRSCIDKPSKFNWRETIVKLLDSKSDKELPLKRLRKKVLAEYETLHGQPSEKHFVKFNKTVLKIPGVVVKKEVAMLISV